MTSSPVILITGASSGIGAATAKLFASRGYRVVLAARRKEHLDALRAEIQTVDGQALTVPTDITQLEQIENLVTQAIENFGQIDILLNNAGLGRLDWLEKLDSQDDIAFQVQVNLTGLIQTTRAVLPHMLAQKRAGHCGN
jgi:NADP-dependent 3-hydroxy acid dehydrogenase YdfG